MRQPFRRFVYVLAEKLSMTVGEIYSKMDSQELSEWMAYLLTSDEKWQTKYTKEVELRASTESGDEHRSAQLKRLFGVR
tara:strand:- start:806 stop:1042 length:237 start_codon:yes stop_codon:yes gene_type:complete